MDDSVGLIAVIDPTYRHGKNNGHNFYKYVFPTKEHGLREKEQIQTLNQRNPSILRSFYLRAVESYRSVGSSA